MTTQAAPRPSAPNGGTEAHSLRCWRSWAWASPPPRQGPQQRPRPPQAVAIELQPVPGRRRCRSAAGAGGSAVAEMQQQPGQWFDAGVHGRNIASLLRKRGLEATYRSTADRRQARIYVRWPGP